MNDLTSAQQFFEQNGFLVSHRPFFTNEGLLVCSQPQISADGVKFLGRSLFLYPANQQQWVVRVTPHMQKHQLTSFLTLSEAMQFALTLLQA